jgi:hypothetical protein
LNAHPGSMLSALPTEKKNITDFMIQKIKKPKTRKKRNNATLTQQ